MSSKINILLAFAAILVLTSATAPSAKAAPPDDACAFLTAAQVSAGVGVPIKDGVPITPTDKKVCTWSATKPAPKSTKFVTLLLQTADSFQAGKSMKAPGIIVTAVTGVGDDAFYLAVGDQVGLIVKKGNVAFKVAVYADIPLADKEAMEKTLALQVVSKL
jgi:hypothetical protein